VLGACLCLMHECVRRVRAFDACVLAACVRLARMWLSPVSAIVAIAVFLVSIRDCRRIEVRRGARGSHLRPHGDRELGRFSQVVRSFRGWPRPCSEYDS
jgi:hypothetical protein